MKWFHRLSVSRKPDFIIGPPENPYMLRWWVIPRNRFFNVYLHKFLHDDDPRALHDHPWVNASYLLEGSYTEVTIAKGGVQRRKVYSVGHLKLRRSTAAHRIELHDGPCWSLFITGPVVREWGFHCPAGWRPWKQFVNSDGKNSVIGKGCED